MFFTVCPNRTSEMGNVAIRNNVNIRANLWLGEPEVRAECLFASFTLDVFPTEKCVMHVHSL